MELSRDRILTTHVGSLPRPQLLLDFLAARKVGKTSEGVGFDSIATRAVADIVARQSASGIDVVNDGELAKSSYTFYIKDRVSGIGSNPAASERSRQVMVGLDALEHPDFKPRKQPYDYFDYPACIGPLAYSNREPLERDIARFRKAVAEVKPVDAFMTSASPGVLTKFVVDTYYSSEDAYVEALAEAMRTEYETVVAAGFVLQIDCPDLAAARNNQYRDKTDKEFLKIARRNVEALNAATANIPPEAMRMHVCWGNYEGPHTCDIPFAKISEVVFAARPNAVSFEGANPRHGHEWEDFKELSIPEDKILIPGVIDSTTNFVEHPKLVAQRICHYADIVGRDRVIAGADCGFSTFATADTMVAPSIVWAKFKALAEGAAIASKRLWH